VKAVRVKGSLRKRAGAIAAAAPPYILIKQKAIQKTKNIKKLKFKTNVSDYLTRR